jgi:hypothetical protein
MEVAPPLLQIIGEALEKKSVVPYELVSTFCKLSSYLACEMIKDLPLKDQQATLKAMKEAVKKSM